jgi:uncharacterized membrane protein YvbJ
MKCNNCGTENETNAKFSGKCGQQFGAVSKTVSESKKAKKSTLASVISVIVFLLAIGVGKYLTQGTFSPSTTTSKVDLINQAVSEARSKMTIPSKLDEVTTLTDVTAEPGAIRYHYTLSGADTSNLSNSYLKNYLGKSICSNSDTKNLLNEDINMEYSYIVSETGQNYFVIFNKTDCQ